MEKVCQKDAARSFPVVRRKFSVEINKTAGRRDGCWRWRKKWKRLGRRRQRADEEHRRKKTYHARKEKKTKQRDVSVRLAWRTADRLTLFGVPTLLCHWSPVIPAIDQFGENSSQARTTLTVRQEISQTRVIAGGLQERTCGDWHGCRLRTDGTPRHSRSGGRSRARARNDRLACARWRWWWIPARQK